MQTGNEMRTCIKNIRYYTDKLTALASKQFDLDFDKTNSDAGTIRADCIAAIGIATEWLNAYCSNIEVHITSAEEQDTEMEIPF